MAADDLAAFGAEEGRKPDGEEDAVLAALGDDPDDLTEEEGDGKED